MSLNDFVILGKLGEGAYSSVHKVKRVQDGQVYALKKVKITGLNQKQKHNALNQVRLLASINSEYIIKYREAFFDQKNNTLCIIIEFADGGDLEKLIEKKKKELSWVNEKQIWRMIEHVLTGLSVLHEKNIIHRDMKSANIFIAGNDYKIADLNVSKLLKSDLASTQTGTPYYASPEVWKDKPYQVKSDIWSFGCIVYELCALKPPFTANSMEGLFKKVMRGIYPKIPNTYSNKLSKIIDMCLQLDPNKRPTAKELLNYAADNKQTIKENRSRVSSVNLLNTIKVPRNLQTWKQKLPKSDYETMSQGTNEEYVHPRFGHVSQNRLREIVRIKNEEGTLKKEPVKKLAAMEQLNSNRQKTEESNGERRRISESRKGELLPRIYKIHSQPNDPHDRVKELLQKLKEQQKRRYQYNRPAWWG